MTKLEAVLIVMASTGLDVKTAVERLERAAQAANEDPNKALTEEPEVET
jgi:hypothetical protein